MKVVVVYESMYGNTHHVADAIGAGLRAAVDGDVVVIPVGQAHDDLVCDADLLVVGGPTHVHGMSRANTRRAAVDAANKSDGSLSVEPDADGPGLREWFDRFGQTDTSAAAFDTRVDAPAALTGRASKRIAKELQRHGCALIAEPRSFLVTKETHLVGDEEQRAHDWGIELGRVVCPHGRFDTPAPTHPSSAWSQRSQ